jgi:hypothetical protein
MTNNHKIPGQPAPDHADGITLDLLLDGGRVDGATEHLTDVRLAHDECVAILVAGEPALFVHGDGTCEQP